MKIYNFVKDKKSLLLKKKYLLVIGVSTVILISGIITGVILMKTEPYYVYLRVNGMWGPLELDPIGAREPPCIWVINQVTEGLFDYNDSTSEIVPNLAISYSWSADYLEFTCNLRQDVEFHDGTDFNAQVVKWNFDRLYNMMSLHPDSIPQAHLWLLPDDTPIIQETQVVNEYTVKFVLNEPYAPFLGLLTTWSSFIVSPASTPETDLIELSNGDLIGTGPFFYDEFIPDVEVKFTANPRYWGGKPAFDKLIFAITGYFITQEEAYENVEAINNSLYSGEIHLAPKIRYYPSLGNFSDFAGQIQVEPSLSLVEGPKETTYNFIGMNNKRINMTWRKAMSYAFDYDFLIEDLQKGWADRMRSPIPEGILYSNTTAFDIPVLNLTIARQIIINDIGPVNTLVASLPVDDDAPWEALVNGNTPLVTFNFTYDEGNTFRESLLNLIQKCFKKIGIKITGTPMPYINIIYMGYDMNGYHKDMFELYHTGWNADYNDPSNYIDVLMSNQSNNNWAQINDHQLQSWMEQAIIEHNSSARDTLYFNIQERFIEQVYPWIMLDIPKIVSIHSTNIQNFYSTSMLWKVNLNTIKFIEI